MRVRLQELELPEVEDALAEALDVVAVLHLVQAVQARLAGFDYRVPEWARWRTSGSNASMVPWMVMSGRAMLPPVEIWPMVGERWKESRAIDAPHVLHAGERSRHLQAGVLSGRDARRYENS